MAAVIDHLIYAVADVEAAGARLAEMGLASYFGGAHPAMGTSNRIVPLGESYIELLGPAPREGFLGWMVRGVPMGPDALSMTRETPDGRVLSWRLDGLTAPSVWELDPLVPVRIEWDEGVALPGSEGPIGRLASVQFGERGITAAVVELHGGHEVVLTG